MFSNARRVLSQCNTWLRLLCLLNTHTHTQAHVLGISVIYKANVITVKHNTGKNYIGITERTFKQRKTQHKLSVCNRKYANRTELAKHTWKLKNNKENYKIGWSIISSASAYNNISKRCNLCLTEKLHIQKASNLNKRNEFISKCRHEDKYFPMKIDLRLQ